MSITYTETKSDTDSRTEIDIGDGRHMTISITGEGIVMDVFAISEHIDYSGNPPGDDERLGTVEMTFDEWAEWVLGLMPRAYHMSNVIPDA